LNINSRNSLLRSNDERNAINAPIQGTAADIIKIAMINCFKRLSEEKLKAVMILQVHDELVFDIDKGDMEKAKEIIINEMEKASTLSVKLTVEGNFGLNWLEAH
jgi:DNA polymerase-1